MDPVGAAFFDEEWESLSKIMFSSENGDFLLQLQGGDHGFLNDHENGAAPDHEPNNKHIISANDYFVPSCNSDDFLINNTEFQQCFSQESSNSSGGNSFPSPIYPSFDHQNDLMKMMMMMNNLVHQSEPMGFFVMDQKNIGNNSPVLPVSYPNEIMGSDIVAVCSKEEILNNGEGQKSLAIVDDSDKKLQQLKRKPEKAEEEQSFKNDSSEYPKKKPRVSRPAQRNKKVSVSKPKKVNTENGNNDEDQEDNEERINAQTSSCSSSDHQDESQDLNRENTNSNSNGKTRANRGAATDPQSLYARKRRERINERLRILQSLVPNGTKVDISTMLEEAVLYVKFLQLQIKLLSSEDLWMYAPIAYNGMDMGLYQNMLPSL